MKRGLLVVCVVPLVLTIAAGCAKSHHDRGVASVGGTASAGSNLSLAQKMVRFAQCMREHGVQMNDPQVNGNDVVQGDILGPDKATVNRAAEACQQYAVAEDQKPVPSASEMAAALQLARCMRAHGVEAFPDPNQNGGFVVDESTVQDPQFAAARQACDQRGRLADKPGGNNGGSK